MNRILEESLDPADWTAHRALGHRMVDDMVDMLQHIADEPVWTKIPTRFLSQLDQPLPINGQPPEAIYQEFLQYILPYRKGNIHPCYWSWVEGTGTVLGMFADMLASGMNSNVCIGDHAAMHIDRLVINWAKEMIGFPASSSGILLSGASMANITAIQVARNALPAFSIRKEGLQAADPNLTVYTSTEGHNSLQKAVEIAGLGSKGLRKVPVDENYQMSVGALEAMLCSDLDEGKKPLCIIASVGTVNTGAVDPLADIAAICNKYQIWMHIDGAFGAMAKLLPAYAALLKPMEQADSIAFDFHKWLYVNYDAGCLLVRNASLHRHSFESNPEYLQQHEKGLAGGPEPISNFGMELSRNFRALKIWMSLKEHGIDKYARLIHQNIAQAAHLAALVRKNHDLELLAPVSMNIVCFRFNPGNLDTTALNEINKEILIYLHEKGIAAPSYTELNGIYSIRVAITNHRSKRKDFDLLVQAVSHAGRQMMIRN